MNIAESRENILARIRDIKYKRLKKIMNALSAFLVLTVGGLVYSLGTATHMAEAAEANPYFGTLMLVPQSESSLITAFLCFLLGCILTSMVFIAAELRHNKTRP